MKRFIGYASVCVGLAFTVSACTSSKSHAPHAARSGAGVGAGAGTLMMKLDGSERTLPVTCSKIDDSASATGTAGNFSASVTMLGKSQTAVFVEAKDGGGRLISQAINGLRDDSGKPVGKLGIDAKGDEYTGTGTFVHTTINKAGKRVRTDGAATSAGSFTLDCSGGYAAVPTPGRNSPSKAKPEPSKSAKPQPSHS
jgi:hypothetical protein